MFRTFTFDNGEIVMVNKFVIIVCEGFEVVRLFGGFLE